MDPEESAESELIGFERLSSLGWGEWVATDETRELVTSPAVAFELELLGFALIVLSDVGTCRRRCLGGSHLLENLCTRVYNLGASAFILLRSGFYDEALNLTRSIGEIGNFISLVSTDKGVVHEWMKADRKVRLQKFSPSAIRKRLEEAGATIIADEDWYTEFCESYTHPTPSMKPNMHNDAGQKYCGPKVQEKGFKKSVEHLSFCVVSVAMMACTYADIEDGLKRLSAMTEFLKSTKAGAQTE